MKVWLRRLQGEDTFKAGLLLAVDMIKGDGLQEIYIGNLNKKLHKKLDIKNASAF